MEDYIKDGHPISDSALPYVPPFLISHKNFEARASVDAAPISPEGCIEDLQINEDEKKDVKCHKNSTTTTQHSDVASSSDLVISPKRNSKTSKTKKLKKAKSDKKKKLSLKGSSRKSIVSANVTEIFSSQFTAYEIFKADFVKAIVDYTKEPEAGDIRNSARGGTQYFDKDGSSLSEVESETTAKNFEDEVEESDYKGLSCKHFGKSKIPHNLIIAASKSGTWKSIYKLLRGCFKLVDRVMLTTDCGNFVVLRRCSWCQKRYIVINACAKNVNAFRYLEFCCETEFLNMFKNLRDTVSYIIDARKVKKNLNKARKNFIKKFLLDNAQKNLTSNIICRKTAEN